MLTCIVICFVLDLYCSEAAVSWSLRGTPNSASKISNAATRALHGKHSKQATVLRHENGILRDNIYSAPTSTIENLDWDAVPFFCNVKCTLTISLQNFTIGGTDFSLLLDTGSGDIAIASNLIPNLPSEFYPFYPLSCTRCAFDKKVDYYYTMGFWLGVVCNETVTFGGLTIDNLQIVAMTYQYEYFTPPYFNKGIVGLAKPGTVEGTSEPFLNSVSRKFCRHPRNIFTTVDGTGVD